MVYLMSNKTHLMELWGKINEISFLLTIRYQILIYLVSYIGISEPAEILKKTRPYLEVFLKLSLFQNFQTCVYLSVVSWKEVEIKGD